MIGMQDVHVLELALHKLIQLIYVYKRRVSQSQRLAIG